MSRFLADMGDNPFLGLGLLAGLLASVACGVVGPYVVSRRLLFLAGAVAHVAVGGVGASIFLSHHLPGAFGGLDPLVGAAVVAVLAAVALALVAHRDPDRLDTSVGALWAVGMSAGILLVKLTPGYHADLMTYLFGNLVFVTRQSLGLLLVLDGIILAVVLASHKRLLALALDGEHAQLQGVDRLRTEALLLVLVALTAIILTRVVGLILVIALLGLPAATASTFLTRFRWVVAFSVGWTALLFTLPRIAVYGSPVSPEPAIVLVAATGYLLALAFAGRRRRRARR